jgi:hypothetical protein
MQNSDHRLFRKSHVGSERLLLWLNEPLAALLTFVTLNLVATFAGLNGFNSATVARQCEPCVSSETGAQ